MDGTNASSTRRAPIVAAGVAALAIFVGLFIWWWSRPPQMGTDAEVFRTVDALFTAVTSRDEKRLADCERRLLTLRDAGKLPPGASTYLDNIIHKARAGRWESAAQSLYDFMRAQRSGKRGRGPFLFLATPQRTLSALLLKEYECDFRDRVHEAHESGDHWRRYGATEAESEASVASLIEMYRRRSPSFFRKFEPFPEVKEKVTAYGNTRIQPGYG